eukprot:SAG11_NODE_1093_length_5906_cov_10.683313_3_plen_152_part_00
MRSASSNSPNEIAPEPSPSKLTNARRILHQKIDRSLEIPCVNSIIETPDTRQSGHGPRAHWRTGAPVHHRHTVPAPVLASATARTRTRTRTRTRHGHTHTQGRERGMHRRNVLPHRSRPPVSVVRTTRRARRISQQFCRGSAPQPCLHSSF